MNKFKEKLMLILAIVTCGLFLYTSILSKKNDQEMKKITLKHEKIVNRIIELYPELEQKLKEMRDNGN